MRQTLRFFLAPVALAICCSAQTTTQIASADANTIVSASTLSAGLGTKSISDIVLTGTVIRHAGDDEQGTITLAANSSGASKVDMNLPSGHIVETNSGEVEPPACGWTGQDSQSHDTPMNNCIAAAPWFFPLISLNPAFAKSLDTGQNTSSAAAASIKVWRVPASTDAAALFQQSSETTIELDAVNLLPATMRYQTRAENVGSLEIPIEVRFSDYRNIGGVEVPFRIEKYLGETLLLEITIDSATFNTGQAIP